MLLRDRSRGRTFCDGVPVRRIRLVPGAVFEISGHRFQVGANGNGLTRTCIGESGLVVAGLSSQVASRNRLEPLLTRMSFTQPAGTVLAILEPVQAGAALFPALLGRPPSSGAMYFHGMNMRTHLRQVAARTGFVPRQPGLHEGWTVRRELERADRARRPPGVRPKQRGLREPVSEACRMLEMDSLLDKKIGDLSAAQRKRLSIAIEILAWPRLLMLEDPGHDLAVQAGLRRIAAKGCTVLLTTSSMLDIGFADQVVVVGTRGRVVFSGDPAALPAVLGADDDAGLRQVLAASTGELAQRYSAGPEAKAAQDEAAEMAMGHNRVRTMTNSSVPA